MIRLLIELRERLYWAFDCLRYRGGIPDRCLYWRIPFMPGWFAYGAEGRINRYRWYVDMPKEIQR